MTRNAQALEREIESRSALTFTEIDRVIQLYKLDKKDENN